MTKPVTPSGNTEHAAASTAGDSDHSAQKRESRLALVASSLSVQIIVALVLGIACGLFFGEYCGKLAIVGDVFVGLLRMTVLPYIIVSLIANFGRLTASQSRKLLKVGGLILLLLWSIALLTILAFANTFPEWKSGSFFSTSLTLTPTETNFVDIFVPANLFASLAENHVPAVVLFSMLVGLALSRTPQRQTLIANLDILSRVLVRVNVLVARLIPLGVFAITAETAGTISIAELGRLQAYFAVYTAASLFLGFVALPCLVASLTPFTYREVFSISRDATLTAFATGKLIVVLPMLIEQTTKLVDRHLDKSNEDAVPAVDVVYPVAYSFPHVGKLLGILFIPFSAWFLGNALEWAEYPTLLVSGLISYFGGPLLATPFLLDLMRLPHDMFQLFLLSGVYGERLGDALGAIHLASLTLLTISAFMGRLTFRLIVLAKYAGLVLLVGFFTVWSLRAGLAGTVQYFDAKDDILANMQLLEDPVAHEVFTVAKPNPVPLLPGESLLERIQRRGVIRVGFNEDKLPFAYFNTRNELVGYDINMAHALARDLDVTIEFVRFDRQTLADQLAQDEFDVVMSGLVGTLERASAMEHTTPYMDLRLALVARDYQVQQFREYDELAETEGLRVGFVDLSRGFVDRLRRDLPNIEFVELRTNQEYFESTEQPLDALLISAEAGAAFTLLYPEFEVIVPHGRKVALPLFYAIGARDSEMRDFLEHWIRIRRDDGTMDQFYDHWILGKTSQEKHPRWSVIRDVLHWIE